MKDLFKITFSLLLFIQVSCNSDPDPQQECIDHFLTEHGMSEYRGERIPCGMTYLVLYEIYNSSYAILHNDCGDLLPQLLIDCNGNELCIYLTEEGCFEMVQNSERIGIIGVGI